LSRRAATCIVHQPIPAEVLVVPRLVWCALLTVPAAALVAQATVTPSQRAVADHGAIQRDSRDVDERSLLRLEDQWAIAVVKRDRAFFDRTLGKGFVYTEDAEMMSREAVIKDLMTGSDTITAARNEGMKVHGYGESAVVTGWLIMSGRGRGGPFEHRYRFTDTWVRLDNRWQIVAAQDYLVPAKKTP
jgi:hypothetical protein